MLRALLLFLGLAALGVAGAWLADHQGQIVLNWGNWRIETTTAVAAAALLALLIVVAGLYRSWRWLLSSPLALSNRRAEGRRRRGYKSLSAGLVAVAAGDVSQAKKLAHRTSQLLDEPALTLLLSAQAAQLDGDEAGAATYFKAMAARPETEFLGLRGLLVQARRAGDRAAALTLARRAFALRPDAPWVGQELFSLEAATGDWRAAEKTLNHTVKRKLLGGDAAARRQAIVWFAQAQDAADRGESKRALELARKAHAQLPAFSPAAALAGRLHGAAGEARKARRLLLAAWRQAPHPDLLAAWLAIHSHDEPAARLDAVQKLIAGTEDAPESRMAVAQAALDAGEFDQARAALKSLMAQAPSARAARMVADLEEAERGNSAAARQWLRQAAGLPADPTWVCRDCNRREDAWQVHCPACGSFDTFVWRQPAGTETGQPHGTGAELETAAATKLESQTETAPGPGVATGLDPHFDPKVEILAPDRKPSSANPA